MTVHESGRAAERAKASEIAGDELFEPEGLRRALATSLADGTEVSRVAVRSLGADQGYASRVDRVAVEYVPVGAGPATLIIKRSHGDTAEITASAAPFLRGATVYRAFAAGRPPIRTPHCYYADVAGDGNAGAFVLEDLGGWTPLTATTGCHRTSWHPRREPSHACTRGRGSATTPVCSGYRATTTPATSRSSRNGRPSGRTS